MVYLNNDNLRPPATYPIYPPYHTGKYLEEYFFNWFGKNKVDTDRNYLDVFWTNIYCNAANGNMPLVNIQNEINAVDKSGKYFTVCQHDDGPMEQLPKDTLIFSAGGNRTAGNIIPIPLICSPLGYIVNERKEIFCSFAGSLTHPLRNTTIQKWASDPDFVVLAQNWMATVPQKNLVLFKTLCSKSKFTLCPRGYGKTSFRLYEAMQLGSVPVYISDEHYLPWADELDWDQFCVIIKPEQIESLKDILESYTDSRINKMVKTAQQLYPNYFSLEGVAKQIASRLL